MAVDAPVRVLFIGALGRSGTTLIERLLGELPGTVSLGEVVHLWERGVGAGEQCGCGVPFPECPFWGKVGELAFGGWDAFDLAEFRAAKDPVDRTRHIPALSRGGGADAVPDDLRGPLAAYVRYYERLYDAVRRVSGARLLIDSSKHASLAFCLRSAAAGGRLDLRVAHVLRDSRGVAQSWSKEIRRPEATEASPEQYMARWSPHKVAMHWNAANGAFALLGRRGVPVRTVRYEEFLADPRGTLRAIAEFAGLPVSDGDLAFLEDDHATLSANHTASGNPMRFTTGRVELRRDDAWREKMPPARRRAVTALTLPLLRHYGYV
ncbi:sulfotransferase [Actinomadura sp. WAC 06369]|uniref:sulfotransferase n=1 Tax=Actinomadura sp. WAC 06369 TaxID=2203193 RepID=UPI0018F28E04|nr:sulfotransferase [Actinomadura sp. WAC 06369]